MMQQLPTQQEMAFPASSAQDPDHYFATKLISQVQRELQKANRRHLLITTRWIIAYEYLKTIEDRLLLLESPLEREKKFFEGTVAIMLGLGRLLVQQLESADSVNLDGLGITIQDLAACVQELEDIERSNHRQWSNGEIEHLNVALGT